MDDQRQLAVRSLSLGRRFQGLISIMRIESDDLLETGTFWFAMADLVVFLPMKLIFRMLGLSDIIRYLDIMTPSRHNFYRVFERKRVKIYDYDPGSFRIKFRIHQRDARDVMTVLNLGTAPIILDNQSVFLPEEAFLIWLFRMTEATRLSTMEDLFGVEATQIGRCFNYMCREVVRENHNLLFNNLPAAIANDDNWSYKCVRIRSVSLCNKE